MAVLWLNYADAIIIYSLVKYGLHGVTSQKMLLFVTTAVKI